MLLGGCGDAAETNAVHNDTYEVADAPDDLDAPAADAENAQDVVWVELPTATDIAVPPPPAGRPAALWPDGERPVAVRYPPDLTEDARDLPAVMLLHGFGASAAIQDAYLGFAAAATARGWIVLLPDGTVNRSGQRFWNAAPSWCCDFDNSQVDDTAYLKAVLDEARLQLPIAADRIHLVGHSNGGYMAHRMACAHADDIAGIASIAGGLPARVSACDPTRPVAMLQVHGTFDSVVLFYGQPGLYPAASQIGDRWASYNGCDADTTRDATRLDLDRAVIGTETQVERWLGCPQGGAVELWQMDGSIHVPTFTDDFVGRLLDRIDTMSDTTESP